MKKKRIGYNIKQVIYLIILIVLLVYLAMLLEIKRTYDNEETLKKERLELLNSTQTQQQPLPNVFDEAFSEKDSCKESWFCSSWSDCRNNIQRRACLDLNNCKTTKEKPTIEQVC